MSFKDHNQKKNTCHETLAVAQTAHLNIFQVDIGAKLLQILVREVIERTVARSTAKTVAQLVARRPRWPLRVKAALAQHARLHLIHVARLQTRIAQPLLILHHFAHSLLLAIRVAHHARAPAIRESFVARRRAWRPFAPLAKRKLDLTLAFVANGAGRIADALVIFDCWRVESARRTVYAILAIIQITVEIFGHLVQLIALLQLVYRVKCRFEHQLAHIQVLIECETLAVSVSKAFQIALFEEKRGHMGHPLLAGLERELFWHAALGQHIAGYVQTNQIESIHSSQ